jgi:uroporphyrinogen decarboxylase
VQDFDFDLAILFSDLLFPLEGLGMGLKYTDQGPRLDWHLDATNFDKLRSVDDAMALLEFQRECVKQNSRSNSPKTNL